MVVYYYYLKHSTYKRIINYYPSAWAHALRISYPQSRDTGAACIVACRSLLEITSVTLMYALDVLINKACVTLRVVQTIFTFEFLLLWCRWKEKTFNSRKIKCYCWFHIWNRITLVSVLTQYIFAFFEFTIWRYFMKKFAANFFKIFHSKVFPADKPT